MCGWAFQRQEQRHTGTKQFVRKSLVRVFLTPRLFQRVEKKGKGQNYWLEQEAFFVHLPTFY